MIEWCLYCKVEPEEEPKEDEMLMDQDEGSLDKQTLSNEEPSTSQQRPPVTTAHSQQECKFQQCYEYFICTQYKDFHVLFYSFMKGLIYNVYC